MSTTQHTQAATPWHVEADPQVNREGFCVIDENGEKVCTVAIIARHHEAWSNAALFAAAPELLEALQSLMQMDVKGHQLQDRLQFSTPGRELLNKARAAIAKATGA